MTSLSPNTRARGTTANITVNGSGFVSGATVSFSGTGITVNTVSGGGATLTINVTVQNTAATGLRDVTVTNPDAGTTTLKKALTIT